MPKGPWNDALLFLVVHETYHGVSLAAASLPISKDGPIVSQNNIFHEIVSSLSINNSLLRILPENTIKGKWLDVVFLTWFHKHNLSICFIHIDDASTILVALLGVHWPHTDYNLDRLAHSRFEINSSILQYMPANITF